MVTDASRLAAHFATGGDRSDIWRALELVVDTDAFLNLGYAGRHGSYLVGDPQRRLVGMVIDALEAADVGGGDVVLDVGCGRGGPTAMLQDAFGSRTLGVDLVEDNLRRGRRRRGPVDDGPAFVRGDAGRLPIGSDALDAAVSIDALVYLDDLGGTLTELERVLAPGGVAVVTDLLRGSAVTAEGADLDRFEATWGFASLRDERAYKAAIDAAGLVHVETTELTPGSVAHFGRYTTAYLGVARSPAYRVISRLLRHVDVDPDVVTEAVRATHRALPSLRHVLVVLEAPHA